MFNKFKLLSLALAALCISFAGHAEQKKVYGDIEVHYMAVNSTFLKPEIAKAYGIQRSKYKAFVNISVLDHNDATHPALSASVMGQAKDLVGRSQFLEFEEIREQDAIYYIAQFDIQNDEILKFTISINDGKQQQELKFNQKFYVD